MYVIVKDNVFHFSKPIFVLEKPSILAANNKRCNIEEGVNGKLETPSPPKKMFEIPSSPFQNSAREPLATN